MLNINLVVITFCCLELERTIVLNDHFQDRISSVRSEEVSQISVLLKYEKKILDCTYSCVCSGGYILYRTSARGTEIRSTASEDIFQP